MSQTNRRLAVRVHDYLAVHPDASANVVWKALGGRKTDVLRAVRSVRRAEPSRASAQGVRVGSTRFPIGEAGQ